MWQGNYFLLRTVRQFVSCQYLVGEMLLQFVLKYFTYRCVMTLCCWSDASFIKEKWVVTNWVSNGWCPMQVAETRHTRQVKKKPCTLVSCCNFGKKQHFSLRKTFQFQFQLKFWLPLVIIFWWPWARMALVRDWVRSSSGPEGQVPSCFCSRILAGHPRRT